MTSYDYDAPIDEYGRPTDKFWRFREVLAEYADGPLPELPPAPAVLGHPAEVHLSGWAPLDDVLETLGGPETTGPVPPTFEELDVDRGIVRYEVTVPGPRAPYPLTARGLRDLAVVYVDGERAGVLMEGDEQLKEPVAGHARVRLWVESLGRVNYGPRLGEPKGITGGLLHERQFLHDVRARGLRLDTLDALDDVGAVALRELPPDDSRAVPGHRRGARHRGRPARTAGLDAGVRMGQRVQSGPVLVGWAAAGAVRPRCGAAGGRERGVGAGAPRGAGALGVRARAAGLLNC